MLRNYAQRLVNYDVSDDEEEQASSEQNAEPVRSDDVTVRTEVGTERDEDDTESIDDVTVRFAVGTETGTHRLALVYKAVFFPASTNDRLLAYSIPTDSREYIRPSFSLLEQPIQFTGPSP
jgi:hypothetical protein